MKDEFNRDKYSFIGIFLGSIVALAGFKDDLNGHINLGIIKPTFLIVGIVFVVLLGLATYVFALSLLSNNERFQQKIGSSLMVVANFFYSVAMAYPITIALLWVTINSTTSPYANLLSGLISLASAVVILIFTINLSKGDQQQLVEVIARNVDVHFEVAHDHLERKSYNLALSDLQKAMQRLLLWKLQLGRYRPISIDKETDKLIELALKKQKITKEQAVKFNKIAQVSHNGLSQRKLEGLLKDAKSLFEELNFAD